MKLKKKESVGEKSGGTELTPVGAGQIQIHHHQNVRISLNYNSAECGYGMTVVVADNEKSIKAHVTRLEELVEGALSDKVKEQIDVLKAISQPRE